MSFTRDYILQHIKRTKYPYWSLYVVRSYSRTHLCSYSGDDFTADDSDEAKVAKSVKRLEDFLTSIPKSSHLSIDLRSVKSGANGTGIIGPLEFDNITDEDAQSQPPQTLGGIQWAAAPPPGYVSESALEGRLAKMEADNEKKMNDLIFAQQKREFAAQMEREQEEIAKIKKELDDDRKKYNSNTAMGAEALVTAFKKIIFELFPQFGGGSAAATSAPALGETPPAPDPRADAVNEIANMLYDNQKLQVGDIMAIKQQFSNAIARHDQLTAARQQADTTAQEGGSNA